MKKIFLIVVVCLVGVWFNKLPAAVYYSCDFESEQDKTNWTLTPTFNQSIADQITNKWYIGVLGNHAPDGQNGLYISDNNGASAHYSMNGCWSMAYDIVTLPSKETGGYTIFFDYSATGNVDQNDGLYLLWIPMVDSEGDSIRVYSIPTSGGIPLVYEGYIVRLQPVTYCLNNTPLWRQCGVTIPRQVCDGTPHYLAFAWKNGSAKPVQPGAMVDNIYIVDNFCETPSNLSVSYAEDKHTLSWTGNASSYEVTAFAYETQQWFGPYEVNDTSYTFEDLPNSATDFIVRSECGNEFYGAKAILHKTVYHADRMCIDFLDLTKAKCYVNNLYPENTAEFNDFMEVPAIDYGPDNIESRHTVHLDKFETDPRTGGEARTIPTNAFAAVRLGNWTTDTKKDSHKQAECIDYSWLVDTGEPSILLLKYLLILETPYHGSYENPRMKMDVFVNNGAFVDTCAKADFNANRVSYFSGSISQEAEAQGWHLYRGSLANDVVWKDWTTVGVNLNKPQYEGKMVTVRLSTFDCKFGAHCGYAYFTLECADRKLKVNENGEGNYEFTAPEGFVYRWYRISDEMILGHEQSFTINADDEDTYAVDCMFVQDSTNYFTLFASLLTTQPVPVLNYERDSLDMTDSTYTVHFDASNSYISEIHPFALDTTVSTRWQVDSVMWDFGDGMQSTSSMIDHVFKAPLMNDTTYTVTLTAYYQEQSVTNTVHIIMSPVPQKSEGLADALIPTLFPTIVSAGQQVSINLDTSAKVRFITVMGVTCNSVDLSDEKAYVVMPSVPGLYVIEIVSSQGVRLTQQLIVQ